MELLSIGYYILIVLFMFMYIACFILNLIRAIKVNKSMKVSYETVKGKVLEIINEKKRVYVKVEYMSPTNHINFVDFFEFTEKEFGDQYYVDQEVEIYYPNVSNFKRVTCFPTYLQGEKIKVKMIRPVEGKREFSGILEDYNDGNITIRMSDESGFTFTKKEASWIKADDFEM